MALDDTGSILVLTPLSGAITPELTPFSARGVTQTLDLETSGEIRRDINGNLIDLTHEQFRKYKSTVSCKDFTSPALDNVWEGSTVLVDCVQELSYRTAGGSPTRPQVGGSAREEGDFTWYRPQLTMMVVNVEQQTDEWPADIAWKLELREV